jgi:hypothetical protein
MMSDGIQFDVGILKRLLHALDVARRLAHQLLARAHQSAKLLRLRIGHETWANETVRQQIDHPFGVADVGLAAGHVLHMRGVRQHQLELAVRQDVPHRLPVDAGRLHGHMGAVVGRQPIAQAD